MVFQKAPCFFCRRLSRLDSGRGCLKNSPGICCRAEENSHRPAGAFTGFPGAGTAKKFHGKGLPEAGPENSLKIEKAKLRRAGCTSAGGMDGHKNGGETGFENQITA